MRGHRSRFFRAAVASGAVALLFATGSVAAATTATGSGAFSSRKTAPAASDRKGDTNGRWIAYSTAPASDASPGYAGWGSDVFVTSVGGRPKLVAGRGKAKVWNVCPSFSPNGRMVAFARMTNTVVWNGQDRSRIVIVRLGTNGPIAAGRLILKVRAGRARCPMWSSNSSRVAYLDRGRVVVRDLHGSRRHRSDVDPRIHDFDRSVDELVSPTGDLVARRGPDGTIVSRLDGSDQRVINDGWTAGWSPDGSKLLFMEGDCSWCVSFAIRAVSVDPPFASETVADHVPLNGHRSSPPGYGAVSWQPIPGRRSVRVIRIHSVATRQTAAAKSYLEASDSNGRWIAYSTAPASDGSGGYPPGGTVNGVFVTRIGGSPKLVAGQGRGAAWNLCPVFSPNGRMLAFARESRAGSTIVVLRIGLRGPLAAGRLVLKVRAGRARCPRWSSNSSRLAYLDRGRVVVRDLHGSTRQRSVGDPTIHDFDRSVDDLASPTGDLIVRRGPNYTIVVSRPDGSDQRVIKDDLGGYPSYGIGGWSPDGRKLLLMKDVGGGFSMRAVSVDPPFASETVVAYARVNDARSWPGYGDVSWQPIPNHLTAGTSPAVSAHLHADGSTTAAAGWPACPAIYTGHVRQMLSGNVCGPKRVIPGVNYSFTVVVTNNSNKTFHPFIWHMSHYDTFTRTSRPYRRTKAGNGDPIMQGAAWRVERLRPRQSLRISFTLPFRRHNDPKGSNFTGEAIGTHDVVFVKRR